MQPLVLDIETLPLAESLTAAYPRDDFSPPANYKNPEAIDRWHAQNETVWRRKRAKECSLNPRLGRVLCLGTQNGVEYAEEADEERRVLDSFWSQALAHGGNLVTWNGMGFDVRFLLIRSLSHGIAPCIPEATIRDWFRKYSYASHFDVKAALLNWDVRASGEGLDEWAAFFGLPLKPDGVDGSDVAFLHANGQHEDIRNYCDHDRVTTGLIYERVRRYFAVAA